MAKLNGKSPRQRITPAIREGLTVIAGFVEAGSSADILGYDEDVLDEEQRRAWSNIQSACEWIRTL